MTISTTTSRIQYNGNSVTVAFSFPYKFLANGDLVVVLTDTSGTDTVQTITTHYTVAGAGDPLGGTVTMITAPATGEKLTIYRELDLTQEVDYIVGDPFPAETHETALDRLTMISQQINEALGRSIRLPVTSASSGLAIPEPQALYFMRWNAAGDALENVSVSTGLGDLVSTNNLSDVASAATARTNLGLEIGTDVLAYDATVLYDADIGVNVQAYDATILNDADIGVNVQAYDANTAYTDTVQSFSVAQRGTYTELTDGATITPNFNDSNFYTVTINGSRTLANPTNLTAGQSGVIYVTKTSTGDSLAYGTYWPSTLDDFSGMATTETGAIYYSVIDSTHIDASTKYPVGP